jgi:HEAT repeat protein
MLGRLRASLGAETVHLAAIPNIAAMKKPGAMIFDTQGGSKIFTHPRISAAYLKSAGLFHAIKMHPKDAIVSLPGQSLGEGALVLADRLTGDVTTALIGGLTMIEDSADDLSALADTDFNWDQSHQTQAFILAEVIKLMGSDTKDMQSAVKVLAEADDDKLKKWLSVAKERLRAASLVVDHIHGTLTDTLDHIRNGDKGLAMETANSLTPDTDKKILPFLINILEVPETSVHAKVAAMQGLVNIADPSIVPDINALFDELDPYMKCKVLLALGELGDDRAAPTVIKAWNDPDLKMSTGELYRAAVLIPHADLVPHLYEKIKIGPDREQFMAETAMQVLESYADDGMDEAIAALRKIANETNKGTFVNYTNDISEAARILGELGLPLESDVSAAVLETEPASQTTTVELQDEAPGEDLLSYINTETDAETLIDWITNSNDDDEVDAAARRLGQIYRELSSD